jgi:hypothetical protein
LTKIRKGKYKKWLNSRKGKPFQNFSKNYEKIDKFTFLPSGTTIDSKIEEGETKWLTKF